MAHCWNLYTRWRPQKKDKRAPITTPPYQVPSVDVTPDPPIFSLVTTFKGKNMQIDPRRKTAYTYPHMSFIVVKVRLNGQERSAGATYLCLATEFCSSFMGQPKEFPAHLTTELRFVVRGGISSVPDSWVEVSRQGSAI